MSSFSNRFVILFLVSCWFFIAFFIYFNGIDFTSKTPKKIINQDSIPKNGEETTTTTTTTAIPETTTIMITKTITESSSSPSPRTLSPSPSVVSSEINFRLMPETLNNKFWTPTTCLPTTFLSSSKFVKRYCRPSPILTELYCPLNVSDPKPLCGFYSAGKFLKPLSPLQGKSAKSKKCSFDQISSPDWFFDENNNNILKSKVCDFNYENPQEIYSTLTRAVNSRSLSSSSKKENQNLAPIILFSGDSMMRQLFLRLISLLRGQLEEPISEHYFHFDAVYILLDGKFDVFFPLHPKAKFAEFSTPQNIRRRVGKMLLKYGLVSNSTRGIAEALMRPREISSTNGEQEEEALEEEGKIENNDNNNFLIMYYQWNVNIKAPNMDFLRLKPAIHVASWMFHWHSFLPISLFDVYGDAVDEFQKTFENSLYVFISTPPGNYMKKDVDSALRMERNEKIIQWLRKYDDGDQKKNKNNRLLVDFDKIAKLKDLPKTADGTHYMCSWKNEFPSVVSDQKFIGENKCLEKMNAALAQILVQRI
jgi:hypothetical protein